MIWLGVGAAGALGAVCRYLVDTYVQARWRQPFPLGTLTVNVPGAFVLGWLTGLHSAGHLGATAFAVVGAGFLGAFTTFSTFSFETVRLLEGNELGPGALNIALTLAVGLSAAGLGLFVGA